MSLPKGFASYIAIVILSLVIVYQFIGANKAEHRAEQLEAQAKDIEAQLKSFEAQSAQREAQAEARYQASLVESATLRSILAKGSQKPITAPAKVSSTLPPLTAAEPAKTAPNAAEGQSGCSPFIYQGNPLVIEQFQVSVCDGQPVVQAEAAVEVHQDKALIDKLDTELAEDTAKIALEEKDLAAYKQAEAGWKKAAHKSRIKRVLNVAEKVGLFAAGVYLGHRF